MKQDKYIKNIKSITNIGALIVVMFCLTSVYSGCRTDEKSANRQSNSPEQNGIGKRFSQVTVKEETNNPNIGIGSYTLITDNAAAHRADAETVMQLKKNYPLAMQTKDAALFNRILARDFTFRGENEFFGREDYIRDRVQASQTVTSAQYENLVLQFVGEVGVLTYRNVVKNKDASGNPNDTEYMTWADIYVKENGGWKIGAVHLIDYRAEKDESVR